VAAGCSGSTFPPISRSSCISNAYKTSQTVIGDLGSPAALSDGDKPVRSIPPKRLDAIAGEVAVGIVGIAGIG